MKPYAPMYVLAIVGFVLSMANGQLLDGGAHLLIVAPWDTVIKASALLAIAAWFVELVYLIRGEPQHSSPK